MTELSKNSIVSLVGGGTATIIKELGRGGQGIVYLVEVCGEKKALKWYLNAPDDKFYRNLAQNIASGAPSDAFLWPEYLTEKQQGSYGYIMKLRPQNYYEFGNFLLAKVSFKSFTAMLSAAMKICDGFMMLHRFGYSYQDLNDGNFFIDPQTGDVLICDNDNVMPQGEKSGIMGKARYMAPEIVAGGIPDKYSDRFSLSVILFMLFYANHPFEGAKVVACPCMTEAFEKKFYGSEALFIYDPTDKSNLPVRGIHQNVIRRWPVFPQMLRDAFIYTMSLLDDVVSVPRRTMTLFFLIDTSGSMMGNKIGAVNDAVVNVLPMLDEISASNPDAEIKVAALEFSNGTNWLYDEPKLASDFKWQDVQANGLTSLGAACMELNNKLSRNGFMQAASGSFAPAIILLSDGGPTDDFQSGLNKLRGNNWFKAAIKIAIAIGDDADKDVLKDFTGSIEAVFTVHNIDALKQVIRVVAVTSSQIGSKSSTAGETSKQEQVIKDVTENVKDIDGAHSEAAAPEPTATNNYDDWDKIRYFDIR